MRKILLSVLVALLASTAFADVLTPQEALSNALNKLNKGVSAAKGATAQGSMTLSYTESSTTQTPLYYVFSQSTGGFLIAGADSRSTGLLGYTDNGSFDYAKENPAFQDWLTECTKALQWLSEQPSSVTSSGSSVTALSTSVAPLLTCKWDQGAPYNDQCPNGAVTGCAATAMAQVMYYHKWPITGTGRHTNKNCSTQEVNFANSTYDWDSMTDTYTSTSTGTAADAVAKLMAEVGCALDMSYGAESSAALIDAYKALVTYFKYNKSTTKYQERSYFTTADWNSMLRGELDASRLVLMGAQTSRGSGHAFVLDGYDTNGLYHVNWGWGGQSNGYFDINYMYPSVQGTGGSSGSGYNMIQEVVVGIQKDNDEGSSTATADLRISTQIMYDTSSKQFSYKFFNFSVGKFSGNVGFILYDNSGNVKDCSTHSRSSNPIDLSQGAILTYTIPSTITAGEGYTIYPYYQLTSTSERVYLTTPQSTWTHLEAYYPSGSSTLAWGYPTSETPNLSVSNVSITRKYVGYAPKFSLTVTNEHSTLAYNQPITIKIQSTSGSTTYCYGKTQVFLEPGESKIIDVECCLDSYKSLTAGEYKFTVYFTSGALTGSFGSSTITMVDPGTPSLTFSGFAIDKTSLKQGENLTASFTAKNTGGFYSTDYRFLIFPYPSGTTVAYIEASSIDTPGNSTNTKVSITGTISLDPGQYFGSFYKKGDSSWEQISTSQSDYKVFTVTAPTAINEVSETLEGSKTDVIYDVTGRRVQSMRKGSLYIVNGKKVVF